MLADGEPTWLLAWRDQQRQREAAPAPPLAATPAPTPLKVYAPRDTVQFAKVQGADLQGMIVPARWPFDGGVRREPVMDTDYPPRVVRKVGWHRCLKCKMPFWSEDVLRQRLCVGDGFVGCRSDEDRFT